MTEFTANWDDIIIGISKIEAINNVPTNIYLFIIIIAVYWLAKLVSP